MVLHAERAAEAQCLGLDVVFDPVVVPLCAVELTAASPCRGAAEQSELHEPSWSRSANVTKRWWSQSAANSVAIDSATVCRSYPKNPAGTPDRIDRMYSMRTFCPLTEPSCKSCSSCPFLR